MTMRNPLKTTPILALGLLFATPATAQVLEVASDATIRNSLCVGASCVNDPTPDFIGPGSTVMISNTQTRINFRDDSSPSSDFPATDWTIQANEDIEFGRDQMAILDVTAGTTPFIVAGGARDNALFVAADGRIGVGTSMPQTDLHITSEDTPGLYFEQDGAGFAPQTWNVGGNETNFFVFDITGDTIPFSIDTAALDESLTVGINGNIGLGVSSAQASLHVQREDSTAKLLIDDTGSGFNTQVEIMKNGTPRFRFDDTRFDVAPLSGNNLPAEWDLGLDNNRDFILRNVETNFNVFKVLKTGNLEIAGSLTENSDKNAKMAIVPIDAADVLAKVEALPIATWSYKDTADVRHIGPMAQDFRALFGTGASDTGISTLDTSGVALAAIKALSEDNKALVADNARLHAKATVQDNMIAQLAARLDALEGQIAE